MKAFDAIVIGAGQAGPFLAARMASLGKKVALIERKYLGGTCVNAGCMPRKRSSPAQGSRMWSNARPTMASRSRVTSASIWRRCDAEPKRWTLDARNGLKHLVRRSGHHVRSIWPRSVRERKHHLRRRRNADRSPNFYQCWSTSLHSRLSGLSDIPYLTSTSIIELTALPRHLVVIGGSYIGLEFAQMYRRFGSDVTIIERGKYLASREDEDISNAIADIVRGEGITIQTQANSISFRHAEGEIEVTTDSGTIGASHVSSPRADDPIPMISDLTRQALRSTPRALSL